MSENKWFTAKGIFLHKVQIKNQKQSYEERIVLVKASDGKEALKRANKEAKDYIKDLDRTKFIEIIEVYELYEEIVSDKCEIFSSKNISLLKPNDYLKTFYPTTPEDCEAIGEKHSWHNSDNKNSACYNCLVKRKGRLRNTRMNKIKIAIFGGSGYGESELLRILPFHIA
jgi:hypothetical protein